MRNQNPQTMCIYVQHIVGDNFGAYDDKWTLQVGVLPSIKHYLHANSACGFSTGRPYEFKTLFAGVMHHKLAEPMGHCHHPPSLLIGAFRGKHIRDLLLKYRDHNAMHLPHKTPNIFLRSFEQCLGKDRISRSAMHDAPCILAASLPFIKEDGRSLRYVCRSCNGMCAPSLEMHYSASPP
jgi:hypothetical protein